jgi:pantoate kinase
VKKTVIEIDSSQLLDALGQLPPNDIKKLIDELFLKKLFRKPDFEAVAAKARRVVKKEGLSPKVVEDAVAWARKQK